jgi:membrane-bound lytic murein transglycosylase D
MLSIALVAVLLVSAACSGAKPPAKTVPRPAPEPAAAEPTQEAEPVALPALAQEAVEEEPSPPQEGTPESEKDDAALLEAAFKFYEESLAALERDDMDAALARLDDAYGLILRLDPPPDSLLLQEKNDLRILVAQRIQKIYASRMTVASHVNGSIPLVENQWVLKEIRSFQASERKMFEEAYQRSGLYMDIILEELRRERLPEQLAWVPLIESAFKPRALSRARALGMWQFIRSTGYRYGLKQDKYIDERMDPLKSTRAAIRYMVELHEMFGDWTTAVAAYNCGEMAVQRVIRAQRVNYFDSFWDLFNNLPYETARHVPRFIATLLIVNDPAKYGFELPDPDPPLRFETVTVATPVKLAVLSQSLGLASAQLTALNPELRHDSTPDYPYDLRVPEGYGEKCLACVAALPKYVPPDVIAERYVVRSGDTLGAIARRYRTSVDAIVRLNNLRSRTIIRVGQVLRIPTRGGTAAASSPRPKAAPGETVTYVVRSGDTLFRIAQIYATTVDRIKADNGLTSDIVVIGQRLTIRAGRIP